MSTISKYLLVLLNVGQALCIPQANTRELYRFPNGNWLENIAVLPNGHLLIADASTASLWEIVPSTQSTPRPPRLVHHFDDADNVGGIAELLPDTYAVIASNSVWKLDLSRHDRPAEAVRIANLTAGFLNGMAALDDGNAVAISDSQLGLVWHLDIRSGSYSVLHRDETMAANSDLGMLVGINGLRIQHDYMYYSNSPKQIFCRVRIDTRTGRALGPYEVISRKTLADDFAIDSQGVAYLAGVTDNQIIRVFPDGFHETFAGSRDSSVLRSATAAAFGRTQNDRSVLYVTTGGDTDQPTDDTVSLGGKVMAVLT